MRRKVLGVFLIVVGLSCSAPLPGHHGNASYDYTATNTVKGTVTDWVWSNPHCLLKLDSKDEKGAVRHWIFEASSPVDLLHAGWNATDLKPGDEATVDFMPVKSGAPVGRIRKIVLADGRVLVSGGRYTL
jgi:Family of unknown function (DUF6152)